MKFFLPLFYSFVLVSLMVPGLPATEAINDSKKAESKHDQPNVILFYIDDLGWTDVGFNGSKYYETPNIDRIANEGINFTNAYANAPNCAPSRACLMSGQYSPRHGIYTVGNSDRGKSKTRKIVPTPNKKILDASFYTLGEMIRDAGYETAFMGKWHLGEGKETGPRGQGFDKNVGGLEWGHPKKYFSPYKNPYLPDGPEGEYLTDRLTDEALDFMSTKRDKPFFLMLSHYAVHTPIKAKPLLIEKYEAKSPVGEHKNPTYAAMIESVDMGIGRMLRYLQENEIAENTIVIFYSDNGGLGRVTSNSPLRGSKGMLYEGGIRVPLAIRWPKRIKPKQTNPTPVIGTDLYPTLMNLVGGEVPSDLTLDGTDLTSLIVENKPLKRDAIYWHFPAYLQGRYKGSRNKDPFFRTRPGSVVRTGDWKLIEYFEDGGLELYNLKDDISEQTNLAQSNPAKRESLHTLLKTWRKNVNAPIPTEPNSKYDPNFKGN